MLLINSVDPLKMKKILRTENGFTLLELLISIALIAVIVGIALGGMKFGISAREIGEQRVDTYQRLRFISEQLSNKIGSYDPLFIQPSILPANSDGTTDPKKITSKKLLAFEGLADSVRFITFADSLTIAKNSHWLHEVQFYLGQHPQTLESGIIMMEQEIMFDDAFITPDPSTTRYILLAKDVSYLKFRYYKYRKLTPKELEAQIDKSVKFAEEWVDEIPLDYEDLIGLTANKKAGATVILEDPQSKISSPRAIEISIGLIEQPLPGRKEDPRLVYLPPTVIPFNLGLQFERFTQEAKSEKS